MLISSATAGKSLAKGFLRDWPMEKVEARQMRKDDQSSNRIEAVDVYGLSSPASFAVAEQLHPSKGRSQVSHDSFPYAKTVVALVRRNTSVQRTVPN